MGDRKKIHSTLGDLIVAVTDEVAALVRDHGRRAIVVSYILQDLFAHRRVHFRRQSALKTEGEIY